MTVSNRIVDPSRGLDQDQVAARLRQYGPNELAQARPRSVFAIALGVLREPMFGLLLAASTIYFVLGDLREAIVLFASIFVVIGITFYQERKSERALDALRDLSSPSALVLRSGKQQRIPSRDVVPDDIVLVHEGDRVPADALLLTANGVTVDESLLTGESAPVRKQAGTDAAAMGRPGGDDLPSLFSGTLMTQGYGTARVTATGSQTEMGKIGKSLQTLNPEASAIQRETRAIVLWLALFALLVCGAIVVLYGVLRGNWLQGVLSGITVAMSGLPEEFPVVLTIFMALGAWRIAKHQVLTRQPATIETLGAITVLCVDKTGTLTQNRMTVKMVQGAGDAVDVGGHGAALAVDFPADLGDLVKAAAWASEPEPTDPMDKAFHALCGQIFGLDSVRPNAGPPIREYPHGPDFLAHLHVWAQSDGSLVTAKGAPEAVMSLCALRPQEQAKIMAQIDALVAQGLRVLGVADAVWPAGAELPETPRGFTLRWLGLMALADPLRPDVPEAVRDCGTAGIRTVMITGDYPGTAQAIARQIGIPADQVLTGPQIAAMDVATLAGHLDQTCIFARIMPEQKLQIVQAFKARGEVVAMTGDGVNDAPALKASHVGIAMGQRGTDVAREAAALVLLDDDFTSIVRAIRMGRRIYDNIRQAMFYLVAVHVPIAGMALLPLLGGWPMMLTPVHIVFWEFLIDPACSIVFEAESGEDDLMRRPPRPPRARLFSGAMLGLSLYQGVAILAAAALLFGGALHFGATLDLARTMSFSSMILCNIGLVLASRSRHRSAFAMLRAPNPALWWIVGGAALALILAIHVPFLQLLFGFVALTAVQWLIVFGLVLVALAGVEIAKLGHRKAKF